MSCVNSIALSSLFVCVMREGMLLWATCIEIVIPLKYSLKVGIS